MGGTDEVGRVGGCHAVLKAVGHGGEVVECSSVGEGYAEYCRDDHAD